MFETKKDNKIWINNKKNFIKMINNQLKILKIRIMSNL